MQRNGQRSSGSRVLSSSAVSRQVGEDKVLRADLADKLDDVELIAGDGGVIKLAVVADLVYQAADLIVALDGLHDGLIGNVDAKLFMQGLKNMGAQLLTEVSIAVLIVLEGNVGEFAEEIIVVDNSHILDGVKVLLLKVLLEAAGAGAGLGRHLRIEEVEAALESSLEEGFLHSGRHARTYSRSQCQGKCIAALSV